MRFSAKERALARKLYEDVTPLVRSAFPEIYLSPLAHWNKARPDLRLGWFLIARWHIAQMKMKEGA